MVWVVSFAFNFPARLHFEGEIGGSWSRLYGWYEGRGFYPVEDMGQVCCYHEV